MAAANSFRPADMRGLGANISRSAGEQLRWPNGGRRSADQPPPVPAAVPSVAAAGTFPSDPVSGNGLSASVGAFCRDRSAGSELGDEGGGTPVDFGDWVGVMLERGRSPAAAPQPRARRAQVEPRGE